MITENSHATDTSHHEHGLLRMLAAGELALHLRLTSALVGITDPAFALRLATASADHLERARRLSEPGSEQLLRTSLPSVDALMDTPPHDWLEGLTGACVWGGVLADLAQSVAGAPAADTTGDELATAVREATEREPNLVGRLSLFGRRVFGRVLLAGTQIEGTLPETESVLVRDYFESAGEVFAARMSAMGLKG